MDPLLEVVSACCVPSRAFSGMLEGRGTFFEEGELTKSLLLLWVDLKREVQKQESRFYRRVSVATNYSPEKTEECI